MTTIIPHRHALRRGTAAAWTADNPVLGNGEEGYETDTGLRKTGDGAAVWTALPYNDRGPAGIDGTNGTDGKDGAPGSTDLTFADNGDGTGTMTWDAGANTAELPTLAAGKLASSVLPEVSVTAADISDATATGRSVLTAASASEARSAIGAGTSSLAIGTSASTAKAGDYAPAAANITDATTVGKAVVTASSAAAARTATGAAAATLGGAEKVTAGSATTGTVTLDCSTASVFTISPTGNFTLALSNVPAAGTACTITVVVSMGATLYTMTMPSGAVWLGSAPTLKASKKAAVTMMTVDGGTSWLCSAGVQA